MKKFLALAALFLVAWQVYDRTGSPPVQSTFPSDNVAASTGSSTASDSVLSRAYMNHTRGIQVQGEGVVARVLPDDQDGSRHQRFLVRLASGQTLLIAHNVDLAPRIEGLEAGQPVAFAGEYEWNERGGVVHWTHRDPSGRHQAGWLRYGGREYQ